MGLNQTGRDRTERVSNAVGILLTIAAHAAAIALVSFTGLKYLYPPPPETSMLIEFDDEPEMAQVVEPRGEQPRKENADMQSPINLVQKSESPTASEAEQPKLDPRASFPGVAPKDTAMAAPKVSDESSDEFDAGAADGNTNTGRADGKPNAHLTGRNTVGNLPRPAYTVQESGTVVVDIWVDNYGNVARAVPGGDGTTVTDKTLWAAARKAAMETHFNMSASAPAMQEGTITYIFNLK